MSGIFTRRGIAFSCEFHADLDDGDDGRQIISREDPPVAPDAAAAKVRGAVDEGLTTSVNGHDVAITAQSICVYSDTPGALAQAVHAGSSTCIGNLSLSTHIRDSGDAEAVRSQVIENFGAPEGIRTPDLCLRRVKARELFGVPDICDIYNYLISLILHFRCVIDVVPDFDINVGCSVGQASTKPQFVEIDSPSKRSRLPTRKNPYWHGISGGRGGVSIGYRSAARGHGAWIAKIVVEGKRLEERLGDADDDGAPLGALTYRLAVAAALDWSRQRHAAIEGQREAGSTGQGPTVRSAVEAYAAERKKRAPLAGAITEGRLRKHVLSDEAFAKVNLSKLRASTIETWRRRLAVRDSSAGRDKDTLAPSTVNRILNDLRAALNASAERHRRELPAHLVGEIKAGTRAVSVEDEARKQLLTDDEVRRIVASAFAVDDTGDFGRLVLLAAATGARYSQLRTLRVCDLQATRVMIPGSKKGRSAKAKAPVAVPLAPDHIEKLACAVADSASDAPLLLRWAYRRVTGPAQWERDHRRQWGPAYEVEKAWAATIAKANLPSDTIMYSLRHSSIVRGLRNNLPIRLVAALHDTSVEMIEAHYSAFIVDATEDLARRATLSLSA